MGEHPAVTTFSRKGVLLLFCCALLTTMVVEVLHWQGDGFFSRFNNSLYDQLHRYFGRGTVAAEVVVVDIDERSLQAVGQWPWPRYRTAELLAELARLRPRAIGLDVLMPEADRTSLQHIKESYRLDFDVDLQFPGIADELLDNDQMLAEVLRSSNTVTATYMLFDHETEQPFCSKRRVGVEVATESLQPRRAPGMLCNLVPLRDTGQLDGFINIEPAGDGILRRIPLLIEYGGRVQVNLVVASLLAASGEDRITVRDSPLGPQLMLAGQAVPIDREGFMLLNFNGPEERYPAISAARLLTGQVTPAEVEDKIVLIGSTASGLYDFHRTVYDSHFPGIEILAVAAGNILSGNHVWTTVWGRQLSLVGSLVSALCMTWVFVRAERPAQTVAGTIGWLVLLAAGAVGPFVQWGLFLPLAAPILVTLLLFGTFSAVRYALERQTSFEWYQKLARSQQVTLESLATVVETRDYETGGHIKRAQHFVRLIAEQLVATGKHREVLTPAYIQLLFLSAPLHDIGKVGVTDRILLKPGKLSEEEFEAMKQHTVYGHQILKSSGAALGGDNFLELAREIAHSHHEKWDGSGYPLGLKGHEIPLSGRIMAIADVYDALSSRRCYKPAYSHGESLAIMTGGRGSFFDPDIFDAFVARADEVRVIAETVRDG